MNKKRMYYIAPILALCVGLLPGVMFSTATLRKGKAADDLSVPVLAAASLHASSNAAATQMRDIAVDITGLTAQSGVYDGAPHLGYTGTPESPFSGEYEIIYTGRGATVYGPAEAPPSDVGRYTVSFSIPDDSPFFVGSTSLDFSVSKSTPSGEPRYTPITEAGKTLADAGLTAVGGDFDTPGSVSWILDGAAEAKADVPYTWVFTPDDGNNYNSIRGSIIPYSTSYVPDEGESGDSIYAGDTVTLDAPTESGASYQWQVNRNDGSGWVDIPGATEALYTTPPIEMEHAGYQYRCAVTRQGGTEYELPYTVPGVDLSQTGDSSAPLAGVSMLFLGLSAAAAALICGKKRNFSR